MFRDALSRWESELGPDHPFLGYPLTGTGRALLALGRAGDARAPLERALRIREASEPDPEQRAETRFALAQTLWATGDRARAAALADQARREYTDASKPKSVAEIDRWMAGHRPARMATALVHTGD
jgi:tetratricopeptide (TPR) repeat protein